MKILKVFTIIVIFFVFFFSSCSTVHNEHKTIVDIITYFDDSGLKAEKIYPALAEMIKASEGAVLVLDGVRFEVYKYDISKPEQRQKLEKIRESGEINILGIKHKVIVNGVFMLLNYQGHPREQEIIRAFENFQ
ncbi:MAG TPA: hypothetical protein P5270_07865 [Victivallales bacterium]|nr:hypothetical protein [Victivallales bacterium]HPO89946.1 hypothetical protein [Victivallales bacterium]HRR29265.1 hypothetical protein [Victivallales bacterium]